MSQALPAWRRHAILMTASSSYRLTRRYLRVIVWLRNRARSCSRRWMMDDGAEVFVKGDSVLKISEYLITDGCDRDSSSILKLLCGGFRKVAGAIGASPKANYEVQPGLASIGIRGTEYVVKLCRQNDCQIAVDRDDADARLHPLVLDGSISLTNAEQVQILMAKGQYATATSQALGLQPQSTLVVGFLDAGEE